MMQSGNGNPMSSAQLALLQQQLAQYGQQQQSPHQPMMSNAMSSGMSNSQQLQQAYLQQQQQQLQQQQNHGMSGLSGGGGVSSQQLVGGIGSNAALAMMQQQRQHQQGNSQMANANMSSYWNALQQQQQQGQGGNVNSAMDASNATSAQLAALARMNMPLGGSNNSSGSGGSALNLPQQSSNSMLLGPRSHSQGLQQQHLADGSMMGGLDGLSTQGVMSGGGVNQAGNSGLAGFGHTNDASILQQQIAQLQRQLQQQQQQNQQQISTSPMEMQGLNRRSSSGTFPQQQNDLLFQMQQQQQLSGGMMGGQDGGSGIGQPLNDSFNMMMQVGGSGSVNTGLNQSQTNSLSMAMVGNSQGGGGGGRRSMTEQEILMQQQHQQQLLRGTGISTNMQPQQNPHADLMGRRSDQHLSGSMNSHHSNKPQNQTGAINSLDLDGSMAAHRNIVTTGSNDGPGDKSNEDDQPSKSFLDGSFAGGWQSNADLPDRRRIIFSILEVIRQMRPDTNSISQKLPHMAKSLEEHLYRSAQSKEEYLDQFTLKKRLQLIAHGLHLHRSSSTSDSSSNPAIQGMSANSQQQFRQFLQMQQSDHKNTSGNQGGIPGMIVVGDNFSSNNQMDVLQGVSGSFNGNDPNDRIVAQKRKVIRQQQQRLLLLRHASKCKLGPNCGTKFCSQMTTLWKHMKKCRDKNCKTSHCLSSRCVLNHYRICKSQGRTASCEVCGPVMEQIKRQDASEGMDSSIDPLAAKPDPDLPSDMGSERQLSVFGADIQQSAQSAQQHAMQQLYQQQQQRGNQIGGGILGNHLEDLSGSQQSLDACDPQQLQQIENAQQKLHQRLQVLKQLQKQQAQLSEQQRQLEEQQQQGQQGQQLQQQHALLQQLQRRCQQQQALIQQELIVTMRVIQEQQQHQIQQCNNMGSPLLGNTSQNSHHSSESQHSQNHGMVGQGMQPQMQSLIHNINQAPLQSMSAGDQNMLLMSHIPGQMQLSNQLHNQMSNQMQNLMQGPFGNDISDDPHSLEDLETSLSGNQDPLQQALTGAPQEEETEDRADPESQLGQGDPHTTATAAGGQEDNDHSTTPGKKEVPSKQPDNTVLEDTSDRSVKSKTEGTDGSTLQASSPVRAAPRGRGGKGKRLREMAEDLMPGPGSATSLDGDGSRKRGADEISGVDGADSSKAQKTDSLVPDTEQTVGQSVDEDDSPSLASSLQKGDMEQHLLMLHKGLHLTSRTITHKCLPIVQQLIDDPYGWVFRDAVDPVVFGLPDYFEVVKNPMHLLLVKKKLENAVYTDMASFERDVKLVFENAILYNGEDSEVGMLAKTMIGVFEKEYKKVCEDRSGIMEIASEACKLCGKEKLMLEPPVLYCSGISCGMSRIQRNAAYYTDQKHQNFWCKACCAQLKTSKLIMLDDGSEIKKSTLISAKHDSVPVEEFVVCNDCGAKVHQICALYNCRKAKRDSIFRCPKCVMVERKLEPKGPCENAKELPKCTLSDFIEDGLSKRLYSAYASTAKELGIEMAKVEKAEGLCVRILSHVRKNHSVRDEMYKRYSKNGCPSDFPVHTKCIGLFQSVYGIDVLLFAMYVYEYNHFCPAPNRRRVYISYLDSVKYLEPKRYRTLAYQSVIVEYLRFVKQRGFHSAHIWSCPPAPGDEYVFHCHPPQQRVPQEEKLHRWYKEILDHCITEGIVIDVTNFYDEYFKDCGKNAPLGRAPDPTCLPYFEGDYIPGEIESIVENLNKEERIAGKLSDERSIATGSKRTGTGLRSGTRSNPGPLLNQYQDKVMNRLGNAIVSMQENFIIARLRNKDFVAAVENGHDVSKWPDDDEFHPESEKSKSNDPEDNDNDSTSSDPPKSIEEKKEVEETLLATAKESKSNMDVSIMSARAKWIGTTMEEDEQVESEMFENRQLFLNYCQTNHCQFDELRRAKHSTMMILFQLHNPTALKFVPKCGVCQRNIVSGSRFHCNVCPNFDLCQDCKCKVHVMKTHSRPNGPDLLLHPLDHTFSRIHMGGFVSGPARKKGNDKDNNKTKTKALHGYLEVLVHAGNCQGPPMCRLNNCAKMKQLFVHVQTCAITHSLGCKICARLLSLIIVHARSCTARDNACPLPYCDKIRERNERLRRHQLCMDDRRRQVQNAHYHNEYAT